MMMGGNAAGANTGNSLRLPRMSGGDPIQGHVIAGPGGAHGAANPNNLNAAAANNLNEIMSEEDEGVDFRINLNSAEPRSE